MQAHICYKEMLLTLQYKSTTVRKKLGPLPELKSKNFLDRGVNKLTLPARAEVIVQLPVTEESSVKEAGDFSFRWCAMASYLKPKCLEQVCEIWFRNSIFCKLFAIHALHKAPKEMGNSAYNIGNTGEFVDNLPATVVQPVTIQLAEWGPVISISMEPLHSNWLASDLHQTLTRSKMSSPGYRHLEPISSTTLG